MRTSISHGWPRCSPEKLAAGRPNVAHRTIFDGIPWRLWTRVFWRDLPARYGNWQTVDSRFRRWQRAAV